MSTGVLGHQWTVRLVAAAALAFASPAVSLAATPGTAANTTSAVQADVDGSSAVVPISDALATHAAEQLLERMVAAHHRLEYDGTLVYLHGHQLSALQIVRRLNDGVASESLLALSGPIRALARNERGVFCMLPDAHSFAAPRTSYGAVAVPANLLDFARIRRHYRVRLRGDSRVAGRETDVVEILPSDRYRYGYRYFIDRATGLSLKSDRIADDDTPVEQVMFTNLEVHQGLEPRPPAAVDPPASGSDGGPGRSPDRNTEAGSFPGAARATAAVGQPDGRQASAPTDGGQSDHRRGDSAGGEARWRLSKRPPGFELIATPRPHERGMLVEHLVVSDGLASVSVYVESGGDGALIGGTVMGAINAVGGAVGDYHATVIGEVPEPTVSLLLEGLAPPSSSTGE